MASLVQRFLATFDISVHHVFYMMNSRSSGGVGTPYTENYWFGFGKKFAVVSPEGTVKELGNSWEILHT